MFTENEQQYMTEYFESKKSNDRYMNKFHDGTPHGETKFRILSKPIIGWEEWINGKPKRYRLDKKPATPHDPKKKPYIFWALIIWDYKVTDGVVHGIKLLTIKQASVIKELLSFSSDEDFGPLHNYDVKVLKSGAGLNTDYKVKALPKSPIANEILEAFKNSPINLDCLFDSGDPFSDLSSVTPLCSDEPKTATTITKVQYDELMSYIYADDEYIKKLEDNVKKHFNCTIKELPSNRYDALLKSVRLYAKEKATKEMEANNSELPF